MLEDYNELAKSAEGPVKIGRITFCTVLTLPFAFSAYAIGTGADLSNIYFFFVTAIIFVFTCVPLSIVGVVTIIRNRIHGDRNTFWYIVTVLAASPIIWLAGNLAFAVLSARVR